MELIRRHHGWSVGAGVSVLLAYVFVLCSMPKHVFWSPDEGGKFLELHSIRWHGGLTYIIPYADQQIDPGFRFYPRTPAPDGDTFPYPVAGPQGTVRFHWPIWFPLLSSCMLRAFDLTGIYIIPLLSGWLTALLSGRIAQALNPRLAPLTIVLVGFATPVFFYSQCFWEHTLATVLGLFAVAVLVTTRRGSARAAVAMALPLVASSMLRIEMVAFAAAALLAWAARAAVMRLQPLPPGEVPPPSLLAGRPGRGWRSILLLSCVAVAALTVVASVPARQQHFLATLPARVAGSVHDLPHLPRSVVSVLVNTGRNEGPVLNQAWATAAGIALFLCLIAPFVASERIEAAIIIPALVVVLAFSAWVAFLDQPYRSLHGLFPIAPFLVIAFYALPEAWRRRDSALFGLASFGLLYLIIGCAAIFLFYVDREGDLLSGLEWGQRYLLALYPVLTILSLAALRSYRQSRRSVLLKRVFTVLVAAMMIIGVQQEIRGLAMLRFNRLEFARWDQALRREGPIVTDLWWLPTTLAPLFLTKGMAYVQSPTELAEWVPLAAAQKISGFTFVSMAPVREEQLASAGVRLVSRYAVSGLQLTRFELVAPARHTP